MALLSRLLGHASDLTPEQTREELDRHPPARRTGGGCLQGHSRPLRIHRSTFDSGRQAGCFTSRKINYLVVPYRAITSYWIETAGTLDMDSELKIWTSSGRTDPIQKTLKRGANIRGYPGGHRCGSLSNTCRGHRIS